MVKVRFIDLGTDGGLDLPGTVGGGHQGFGQLAGERVQSAGRVGVHRGLRSSAADDVASVPERARVVQEHHVLGLYPWALLAGSRGSLPENQPTWRWQ